MIRHDFAISWISPIGNSTLLSRRRPSPRRAPAVRRASRSPARTHSSRRERNPQRRASQPRSKANRPRRHKGGGHHETDRCWLGDFFDNGAHVWAGRRLVARGSVGHGLRWGWLLERQRLAWGQRIGQRRLLERYRFPRQHGLRWGWLVERQWLSWGQRIRQRRLLERYRFPRQHGLRRWGFLER